MQRTWIVLFLMLLAMAVAPGCRSQARSGADAAAGLRIEPLESRVVAIHGHTLVMPIELRGDHIPEVVAVRLDDRRTIVARLVRIGVSSGGESPSWLAPPGRWSVTAASAARSTGEEEAGRREGGWWALVLDLPHDAINQSISVGQMRIALHWFLDPADLDSDAEATEPPHRQWSSHAGVLELARPAMLSPVGRWRYRLLADGLSPSEPSGGLAAFEHPVLEALARQGEMRWTLALDMLWRTDRALAERLKRRLVTIVAFPGGTPVPAWPVDEGAIESLLQDLLNTTIAPEERRARAAAWLDSLAPATAWIVDDAGLEDALSGATVTTAAVANLLDRDMVASAVMSGEARSPELLDVGSMSVRHLTPASPGGGTGGPRQITFNVGRWSALRAAVPDPVAISPPGLRLEPLMGDWTLPAWLNGAPLTSMRIAPAWSTSALLHFRAREDLSEAGSAGWGPAGDWVLHVECRGEPSPGDEVAVWMGPFGAPRGILRITPEGVTDTIVPGGRRHPVLAAARISRLPDRWVAQVPIPAGMIDSNGELRLSIVRTDPRGVRSAWPRPMLPWQNEPGRLSIDTGAWGDVAEPGTIAR